MVYFDLIKPKFSLGAVLNESIRTLTLIVTTVWHLVPLRKCDCHR